MASMTRRTALTAAAASLAASSAQAVGGDGARRLRVAVAQMQSDNHDVDGNLARAEGFAERAARRGARLVLFPELMPGGYSLYYDIWDNAEPAHGKTSRWLARTSRRLGVWLGTSFLEADGEDFFNTFVMTGPDGAECGRVRKQAPAATEAYFFKGAVGSHVIETAIGRIGVGICAENYYCFIANQMSQGQVDFILMPHSAPISPVSPPTPGTHLGLWYARRLGVPVAFVNKVGPWVTRTLLPPPAETRSSFPGLSAIVDSDASVLVSMNGEPDIGVADITLDPHRRAAPAELSAGFGIPELAVGGPAVVAAIARAQMTGAQSYATNPERPLRARAISGG